MRLRQGQGSDRALLISGFERLSEESRYRRFLASMPQLTESMIEYLTEIDHRDHEAIVALDAQTGEGIGVARFVRDPGRPDMMELLTGLGPVRIVDRDVGCVEIEAPISEVGLSPVIRKMLKVAARRDTGVQSVSKQP